MIEARFKVQLGKFSLDADLQAEGFTGVVGPNGAGKTTLLLTMAGFREANGELKVDGVDVIREPPERRRLVYVDSNTFIPHLEVWDHLRFGAKLRKREVSDEEVKEVAEILGVPVKGRVGKLSLGNKIRVSLATALLSGNRGILVDEVFTNLHESSKVVNEFKRACRARKVDVVFTTHVEELAREAERLYLVSSGKTVRKF